MRRASSARSASAASAGLARVCYGSTSGLGARAPTELVGAVSGFGRDVAAAGDVDGDGYEDVVVGVPAAGRAYVFRGAAGRLATTAAWVLEHPRLPDCR